MRVVLCRKKLLFASVLTMLVVLATTQLQAAPPLPGSSFRLPTAGKPLK